MSTITIKRGDARTIALNLYDIQTISQAWMFGVDYVADEYVYIKTKVYKCLLDNTADTSNKPDNATYWEEVDCSIVKQINGYPSIRTPKDITNTTVYYTVRDSSTLNDTDDTSAVIAKVITAHSNPTRGITEASLTSTDTNLAAKKYLREIQIKDNDKPVGSQISSNSGYGDFIIEQDETKAS